MSPRSPTRIRSSTGWAEAGVRAYSAGCSTPSRRFSFSANHPDGRIDAIAIADQHEQRAAPTSVTAHQRSASHPPASAVRRAIAASRSVSVRAVRWRHLGFGVDG